MIINEILSGPHVPVKNVLISKNHETVPKEWPYAVPTACGADPALLYCLANIMNGVSNLSQCCPSSQKRRWPVLWAMFFWQSCRLSSTSAVTGKPIRGSAVSWHSLTSLILKARAILCRSVKSGERKWRCSDVMASCAHNSWTDLPALKFMLLHSKVIFVYGWYDYILFIYLYISSSCNMYSRVAYMYWISC